MSKTTFRAFTVIVLLLTASIVATMGVASHETLSEKTNGIRNPPSAERSILASSEMSEDSFGSHVNASRKGDPDPWFLGPNAPNTQRSVNWTEKKADYVVDEDSLQIVIGVSKAQASTYDNLLGVAGGLGGKLVNTVSVKNEVAAMVFDVPLDAVTSFREEILKGRLVTYVEPNMKLKAQIIPNDPNWTAQWGPQKIDADWAWNETLGSHDILVAVVDTGIDYTHPDIAPNYATGGYDWVNHDADPKDDCGHGTHCAGIIAAVLNNGVGVAGLAQVRVMSEKVLNKDGWGSDDSVANGIIHATDQGADIISMSLGGTGDSEIVREAVRYAYSRGVLLVAAAGNDDTQLHSFPAAYLEVIAVSATRQNDTKASWSNWGDWIELAAPGVNIYSAMPTYNVTMNGWGYTMNYSFMSGTSMACPHVAGLAALTWGRFPNATRDWVRARLESTAVDLGALGFDVLYGYGRINARKAVEALQDHDVALFALEKPKHIQPKDVACLNVTVMNCGLSDEQNVAVQLFVDGSLMDSVSIGYLSNYTMAKTSLSWTPVTEGTYNVTLCAVPVSREAVIENNVMTTLIEVKWVTAFVLLDQTRNCPIDFYSVFVENLTCRGYAVDTYDVIDYWNDYIPISAELLSHYDALIIPGLESSSSYSLDEIMAIQDFVRKGGGFLIIGGLCTPETHVFSSITCFAGIAWKSYGIGAANTSNIVPHETTEGVGAVYGGAGNDILTLLPPALELVRCPGITLAISEIGAGRIACVPVPEVLLDSSITQADNDILANNIIDWLCVVPKREHDLVVSLDVPAYLEPSESTSIRATVLNSGLRNESNVVLQLLIDGTLEASVTVWELRKGANYAIDYPWASPSSEGNHTITAYSPSVQDEDFTLNNLQARLAIVRYPLIKATTGQYVNYTIYYSDLFGYPIGVGCCNFTYGSYFEPHKIWITSQSVNEFGTAASSGVIVNTMTGLIEIGISAGLWYSGWAETNIDVGSSVNVLYESGIVRGSGPIFLHGRAVDCWEVIYLDIHGYNYTYRYDKVSGLQVSLEYDDYDSRLHCRLLLSDTQIQAGIVYAHDVGIYMDTPWCLRPLESSLLNITVRNVGLSNEANVHVRLSINASEVAEETLTTLASDESETMRCLWTPSVRGIYNITAYVVPTSGEDAQQNNVAASFVQVRCARVALMSESMQLTPINTILTSMGDNYDIYNFNQKHLYTENLTLLNEYSVVIFYASGRDITTNEYFVLRTYVARGGNLLVTGPGALDQANTFLADVVCSSTTGSDPDETDLYVVESTYPIMNGPYGSFPAGYQVCCLYGGCNMAKAEKMRGAVSVAELADGYDKIIATEGLLGKVVFWNGDMSSDCLWGLGCAAMFKNTIDWFVGHIHNIVVVDVKPTKTVVSGGYGLNISVTLSNQGNYTETFNVHLYANNTAIGIISSIELAEREKATIAFKWGVNGSTEDCYTVKAVADTVPDETNITDNTATASQGVCISILGDTDGDFDVDLYDAVKLLACYGAKEGEPNFDPNCDIDNDGRVFLFDAVVLLSRYGQKYP